MIKVDLMIDLSAWFAKTPKIGLKTGWYRSLQNGCHFGNDGDSSSSIFHASSTVDVRSLVLNSASLT